MAISVGDKGQSVGYRVTGLNWAGLLAGAIALLAAVVSPWALQALTPPSEPLGTRVGETARQIMEAARSSEGSRTNPGSEERGSQAVQQSRWDAGDAYLLAVMTLGAGAVVFGAIAFVLRHDGRSAWVASALGAGALVSQYAWMFLGVIVFVLLVAAVLAVLGRFGDAVA